MGADVVIKTRNAEAAKTMVGFMETRLLRAQDIAGLPSEESLFWLEAERASIRLNKISAYHGYKRSMGYALCRFMALKVGRHQKFFRKSLNISLPYIKYDDFESWPVLVPEQHHLEGTPKAAREFFVDDYGVPLGKEACDALRVDLPFIKLQGRKSDREEYERLWAICGGPFPDDDFDWGPCMILIEEILKPLREAMIYLASQWRLQQFKQQNRA